jgi:hypothetical protein
MISQLKEITDAGYQEDTTVLVYFDPNCNGTNARIFEVNHFRKQRGAAKGHPTSIGDGADPYVRNIAEDCHIGGLRQMPAAVTLRYFLEYSSYYYPAENYMLFLMGHGVIVGNDAFLPDTDDGSAITLQDLGKVLTNFSGKIKAKGAEFHLIGFHSCSMSSVELASELRGTARYMVGTQGSAFPGSWPYRQMLKKIFHEIRNDQSHLAAAPGTAAVPATAAATGVATAPVTAVASATTAVPATAAATAMAATPPALYPTQAVQQILAGVHNLSFYNGEDFWYAGYSADLCMCSLDGKRIDDLTLALEALASALTAGLKNGAKKGILLAHCDSQSYFGERYTDIYDLCERLLKYCDDDKPIKDACVEIKKNLETYRQKNKLDLAPRFEKLIAYSDFYGPSYQFSHGLSIYFPWSPPTPKVMATYANYAFTKRSGADKSWMSFLEAYFKETQREWDQKGLPIKFAIGTRIPLETAKKTWSQLTDNELLSLGNPPPDKESPSLAAVVGDKETPSLETGTGEKETPSLETGTGEKETPSLETGAGEKETPSLETGTGEKETPSLETGTGEKESPSLDAIIGDKESPTLATPIGDKESPSLAATVGDKETPSMGALGRTVIKNFPDPAEKILTSRPRRSQRPPEEVTVEPPDDDDEVEKKVENK